MQMTALIAILLAALASAPAGPHTGADERSDRTARIDAIFAQYAKDSSPGCAVAVYDGDRIAFSKAYGMANLDHDVRLTPSAVFHVASVSKQFTGTAILLLAQDGKLSLDDDIRKHLPELPDFGKTITIRQLANHTSGLRDQWDLLNLAGWRYSRDLITDDDVMELLTRQRDLNFTPGDRHMYSNTGFTLLALIASRVSGKSFREFTTERIFEPLGMKNTHFRDRFTEIVKNQAYGYSPEGSIFRLHVTNFDTAGATSLLTTVEDLSKWHANFDKGQVGGETLRAQLLERGALNSGRRIDYAFGITHGRYRGVPLVGHGGSDAGYRADFLRFPEQKLGIATLCNLSTANPGQLSRRVADLFLPEGLPPADADVTADSTPEVDVPESTLRRYAGFYFNAVDGGMRTVSFLEGKLQVVNGRDRIALKPIGNGTFVTTSGAPVRHTFAEGGTGVELRLGSNPEPLLKSEPFTPTPEQMADFAGTYRSDEFDAVYRMALHEGAFRLERSKMRPSPMLPLVKDTFRAQPGVIQFTRDADGRVSGFVLQGGRVKHVKFWKDPASPRTTSTPR